MRSKLLARLAVLSGLIACIFTIPVSAGATPATSVVTRAALVTAPAADPAGSVQALAPNAMLIAATSIVIDRLKQDRDANTKSKTSIAELLETTILPLFDFRHMTQLAVARNWKLASPEQQESLVAEFKTLLVRTYYAALVNYRDEVIEYKPLQLEPLDTDITVRSTVKKPGVERMTIDYDMEKMTAGWKVYDIRIAGISLTMSYRSSFAEIVSDRGVDELIRYLADKNRLASSGPRSDDSEARGLILLYGVVPSLLGGPH